jgi:hypothetical protein
MIARQHAGGRISLMSATLWSRGRTPKIVRAELIFRVDEAIRAAKEPLFTLLTAAGISTDDAKSAVGVIEDQLTALTGSSPEKSPTMIRLLTNFASILGADTRAAETAEKLNEGYQKERQSGQPATLGEHIRSIIESQKRVPQLALLQVMRAINEAYGGR